MLQHILAGTAMIIVAEILFNSYVTVNSMDGVKTCMVDFLGSDQEFEDSELFQDIFETSVSDITRLVVIREQLETDGVFDPARQIDVTAYASRRGNGNDCPITAVYELDDLIKWGKYGVEYTNRSMSMSDFVNYFGEVNNPANFALDESGNLYFRGFVSDLYWTDDADGALSGEEAGQDTGAEQSLEAVIAEMRDYTSEQLDDMAFSYIIAQVPQGINMSREEDGTLTVYFTALNCRFETVDGERQLFACADNWVDYMKLQNNLVDTITGLTASYQQYQNCNELYQEGRSNLKYAVRMMTDEGVRTYTNVSELADAGENVITDYFGEYRRYLIYYPDSLEFSGNTGLRENDIYDFMREYEYAYPETTHIWIGVDTGYSVPGDAFYNANAVFQKVVPRREVIIAALAFLALGWMGVGIYLTVTSGIAYDEDGRQVKYLNPVDHIWTEFTVLLIAGCAYCFYRGFGLLLDLADQTSLGSAQAAGFSNTSKIYSYGVFALYGMLLSLFFDLFWYSLVRRARSGNLWKGSFICWFLTKIRKGIGFVLNHANTAVSTLIPYNLFLLVNLVGIFVIYMFREQSTVILIVLAVIVAFDGIVGVLLFRNSAEKLDIVEGIRRIRDGDVEYKLDTESLHGTNREMADAVNNIGEGIHKAVRTSMKDEQMKTDLITNVSHDLKTPLTSIISYVDLLKRLKIEDEPARSYIGVLDNKSQRLKQLTDDLVEVSKISSGNIELQREKLNLAELLNQSLGEFSEKLEERRLQAVFDESDTTAFIYADSRRMWRIIENLFNNICKYALEGTRVYIDLHVKDGVVELSLKNISERPMNLRGDDLTERFIRGDDSRTTEGSGLGLSIAKSLTQVQGGTFSILLDGDLFKVTLTFPEYAEQEEPPTQNQHPC